MTGAISATDGTNRSWHLGTGLEGRGGIVTGATSGIGRAVTISMAEAGARVAAIDRDEPAFDPPCRNYRATVTCRWYSISSTHRPYRIWSRPRWKVSAKVWAV